MYLLILFKSPQIHINSSTILWRYKPLFVIVSANARTDNRKCNFDSRFFIFVELLLDFLQKSYLLVKYIYRNIKNKYLINVTPTVSGHILHVIAIKLRSFDTTSKYKYDWSLCACVTISPFVHIRQKTNVSEVRHQRRISHDQK